MILTREFYTFLSCISLFCRASAKVFELDLTGLDCIGVLALGLKRFGTDRSTLLLAI